MTDFWKHTEGRRLEFKGEMPAHSDMAKTVVAFANDAGGIKDAEVVAEEPREYANLTYDSGFKIVLGTEGKSEGLLMALLNRLLKN